MVNYCSECGYKLDETYKFCPNCGTELDIRKSSNQNNEKSSAANLLICTNCGEENPLNETICRACGVKLERSKAEEIFSVKNADQNRRVHDSPKSKSRSKLNKKNREAARVPVQTQKKLEPKKIIALVFVILIILIVVLAGSGVFDSPVQNSSNLSAPSPSLNSGIDLSAVTKINELKSLAEKNPENASLLLELANLRFDSGFFEDAAKSYEQYLKLMPSNADARIDMAVCYYNLQQFDKAETEMLTALKYSPNHQTGYLNLGVVYLAKQDVNKAKEWFQKAVDLNPNSEIGKKAKSLLQSH